MDIKPTNSFDNEKTSALEDINKVIGDIKEKAGQMDGSDELLSTAKKLSESVEKIMLIEKLKKLRQEVDKYEGEVTEDDEEILRDADEIKGREVQFIIPEEEPSAEVFDSTEPIETDQITSLMLKENEPVLLPEMPEDTISAEKTSDEAETVDAKRTAEIIAAAEEMFEKESAGEILEKEVEEAVPGTQENTGFKEEKDIAEKANEYEGSLDELEDEIPEEEEKTINNILFAIIGAILLIGLSIPLVLWITRMGSFPAGAEAWGHLFKSNTLYKEILSGNFYPLFSELWYSGTEPLRFWAPLPHYLLAVIQLILNGNVVLSYNVFIAVTFVLGGFGWLLIGAKTGRQKTGLVLAILWFMIPDNLRVLFSDGNLSRVFVNALIPLIIFAVICLFEKRSAKSFIMLGVLLMLASLSHTLTTALIIAVIFIYSLIFGISHKKIKEIFIALLAMIFGTAIAGIWLYPAFSGASFSIDLLMFGETIKTASQSVMDYVNPYLRVGNPEVYYFGATILAAAVIGLIAGQKKSKPAFLITILLFVVLPQVFLHLIDAVPVNQLTWIIVATPIAAAACFAGLILWKKMNKVLTAVLLILIVLDCCMSFVFLAGGKEEPTDVQTLLNSAIKLSTQKVALLDGGEFGSYPSYYLSYNVLAIETQQTFGIKSQVAETASNSKQIEVAFEKGLYGFVFDRTLELGADTIVLKKDEELKYKVMIEDAKEFGYKKVYEDTLGIILKLPINNQFGTTASYKGLGIGVNASYLAYMFPQVEIGDSEYIEDYTFEELKKYEIVYLSGFKYKNKATAENMITQYSMSGVKFIIDMTDAPVNIGEFQPSFLGVSAQPVTFSAQLPDLKFNNEKYKIKNSLPPEYKVWNTHYLQNLDSIDGKLLLGKQEMSFLGTKVNDNIVFIGFNLPKFAIETRDIATVSILEKIISLKLGKTPDRKIQKIELEYSRNKISIKAEKTGTIVSIANLDSFAGNPGKYEQVHNLIKTVDKEITIDVGYPYLLRGGMVSGAGLILLIVFGVIFRRKEN